MAKRMTRMAAAAVAATSLTPLLLAGCATKDRDSRAARDQADINAPITRASAGVMRYRIKDWAAPNDHTVIIMTEDGTKFRAETLGPCQGLAFTTRVGFVNRGGFNQIDRTSSVVLEDGTRCPFQSFDEIRSAESRALDSYERAGEAIPKKE
jgi:outer membrane murein-binding lipoprotein Lpp